MASATGRIAVEMCFIPADAYLALRDELPDVEFVDALPMLQELRAVKRPDELEKLRIASETNRRRHAIGDEHDAGRDHDP